MLIPFFVMSIAFGGVISPRLNLILNLICRKYYIEMEEADPNFTRVPIFMDRENPACRIPAVQSRVSNFTLYGNLIAGLISAMTAPKLGALSDRYGRTRLIALTSMGTLAGDIFTIAAATYPTEFPVDWILVGFFFDGLCGSFTTAFAIVNAYVTDCCPPATRGVAFSYFHGCLFFGLAFGPVTAGLITKATGSPISVFYVMLLVHVFFMIFTGLIAPESLSPKRKEQAKERYARLKEKNSHKTTWEKIRETNIFAPLKILWPKGEGTTPLLRRNLVLLAAIDTTMFGVAMGSMTVIVIYSNYAFGWGTVESSFFMSIVNSCRVLCLILIMPVIVWIFKTKPTGPPTKQKNQGSDRFDLWVIRVAVLSDTLGYVGYALANSGNMMIAAGSISSIGGLGSPTLQSALTKHVPPDKTGQVLGASGLLHALARVLAPTIFNGIYTWTVDAHPRAVFLCLTATFSCAFMMTWFVRPGGMYQMLVLISKAVMLIESQSISSPPGLSPTYRKSELHSYSGTTRRPRIDCAASSTARYRASPILTLYDYGSHYHRGLDYASHKFCMMYCVGIFGKAT